VNLNVLVSTMTSAHPLAFKTTAYSSISDIANTLEGGIDLQRRITAYTEILRFYMRYRQKVNTLGHKGE